MVIRNCIKALLANIFLMERMSLHILKREISIANLVYQTNLMVLTNFKNINSMCKRRNQNLCNKVTLMTLKLKQSQSFNLQPTKNNQMSYYSNHFLRTIQISNKSNLKKVN